MVRIYEVSTELDDTTPGQSYDRFNVAAENFNAAVEKANRKLANEWKVRVRVPEKIQSVVLIASEG